MTRFLTSPVGPSGRSTRVDHGRLSLPRARTTIEADGLLEANGFDDPAGEPLLLHRPGVDTVASGRRRA